MSAIASPHTPHHARLGMSPSAWYASPLSSPGSGPSSGAAPISPRERMRMAKQALIKDETREMRAVHDKKRATREASIVAQIASAGLAKSAFPAPSLAPPGLHPGDISASSSTSSLKKPPAGILRKASLTPTTTSSPQTSVREIPTSRPTTETDFGPAMPDASGSGTSFTDYPPNDISARRRSSRVRFSKDHLPSAKSNPASVVMTRENSMDLIREDSSIPTAATSAPPPAVVEAQSESGLAVTRPPLVTRPSDTSAVSVATIAQAETLPRGLAAAVTVPITGTSRLGSDVEDMFTPQPLPYPRLSKVLARLSAESATLGVLSPVTPSAGPSRAQSVDWASFVPDAPEIASTSRMPSMHCPSSAASTRDSTVSVPRSNSNPVSGKSSTQSSFVGYGPSLAGMAGILSARESLLSAPLTSSHSSTWSGMPERMSESAGGAAYAALLPSATARAEGTAPAINRQPWEDADLGLSPRSSTAPGALPVELASPPPILGETLAKSPIPQSPPASSLSIDQQGNGESVESFVFPLAPPIGADSRASTIDSYYRSEIPDRRQRDYHLDSVDALKTSSSSEPTAAAAVYMTLGQRAAAVFNAAHSPPPANIARGILPSQLPVWTPTSPPPVPSKPHSPSRSKTHSPASSISVRDSLRASAHTRTGSDFSVDVSFPLPPDRLNVTIGKLVLPAPRKKKASINKPPVFLEAEAVVEIQPESEVDEDTRIGPLSPPTPARKLMEEGSALTSSPCPDAYSLTAAVMQVGSPIRESFGSLPPSPVSHTVASIVHEWKPASPAGTSHSTPAGPSSPVAAQRPRPESPKLEEIIAQTLRARQSDAGFHFLHDDDDLDLSMPLAEAALRSNILSPSSRLLLQSPSHSPSSSKSGSSVSGRLPAPAPLSNALAPIKRGSAISSADLRSGVSLTKGKGWSGSESEEEEWATTVRLISMRKNSIRKGISSSPVSPIGSMGPKRPKWASKTTEERYSNLSNVSGRSDTSLATTTVQTPSTPTDLSQAAYTGSAGAKRSESGQSVPPSGSQPGRYPWGKSSPVLATSVLMESPYESILDNPALRAAVGYDPTSATPFHSRAVSLPVTPTTATSAISSRPISSISPRTSVAISPRSSVGSASTARTPALRIKKKLPTPPSSATATPEGKRRSLPRLPKPSQDVECWGEPEILIDDIPEEKAGWEASLSPPPPPGAAFLASPEPILEEVIPSPTAIAVPAPMPVESVRPAAPARTSTGGSIQSARSVSDEMQERKDSLATKAELAMMHAEEVAERTRLAILESTRVITDNLVPTKLYGSDSSAREELLEAIKPAEAGVLPAEDKAAAIPAATPALPPSRIPRSTSSATLKRKPSTSRIPVPSSTAVRPGLKPAQKVVKSEPVVPVAPSATASAPTSISMQHTVSAPVLPADSVADAISSKMALAEFRVRAKLRAIENAKDMQRSISADSDGKVATAGLSAFGFWNDIPTTQPSSASSPNTERQSAAAHGASLSKAKSVESGLAQRTSSKIPYTPKPRAVPRPLPAALEMKETQSAGPVLEHPMEVNPKLFPVTSPRALYGGAFAQQASEALKSMRVWPVSSSSPSVPTVEQVRPELVEQSQSEPIIFTLNEPTPKPTQAPRIASPQAIRPREPSSGASEEDVLASLLNDDEPTDRVPLTARLAGLMGSSITSSSSSLRSAVSYASSVASSASPRTASASPSASRIPVAVSTKLTKPRSAEVEQAAVRADAEVGVGAQGEAAVSEMGVFGIRTGWFSSKSRAAAAAAAAATGTGTAKDGVVKSPEPASAGKTAVPTPPMTPKFASAKTPMSPSPSVSSQTRRERERDCSAHRFF